MSIEGAIYARLSNYSALAALVSDRIYPVHLPQDSALPAVVFQKVSGIPVPALVADTDLIEARYQVTCIAESYDAATGVKAVADQVRAALRRYKGTLDSTKIEDVQIIDETDLYDDDDKLYLVAIDVFTTYRG